MKKINLYSFKKDRYSRSRGGYSRFLNLYCSNCKNFILLYQKDGPGILKRLYLDRIFFPADLSNLEKKDLKINLICKRCKTIIGFPIIYEKENRRAFLLKQGSFIKKITKQKNLQDMNKFS